MRGLVPRITVACDVCAETGWIVDTPDGKACRCSAPYTGCPHTAWRCEACDGRGWTLEDGLAVELVECNDLKVGDWFLFDGSETPVVIHRRHRHGAVVDVWLMAGGERVTLPRYDRIRKVIR